MHWDGDAIDVVLESYPYWDDKSSMASTYGLRSLWGYTADSILALGATTAYFNGDRWLFPNIVAGDVGAYGESVADTITFGGTGRVYRVSCQ